MISIRTWLVLAVALAACELEPPPKPAPAEPPPPPTAVAPATPAPPPTAPVPVPRATVPAPVQPTNPACLAAAVHFTDVTIATTKGPTRTQLEHERTMIVKQTEDACNAQHWSQPAIECFTSARSPAALHACDKLLAAPSEAAAPPGAVHEVPHDPVIEGHAGSAGSGSTSTSTSGHKHHTRSHDHSTHSTHSSR